MASRELLSQIAQLLRPLRMRIAGIAARGVVHIANDAKKLQMLQIGVLADEVVDDAEHHQPYGFTSVPLEGAEVVVIFPNGDRSHPLVVATSDRRYRPTGGEPGQVTLYHYSRATVTMLANGNIEMTPGGGGQVKVGTAPVALATKADVTALANFVQGLFVGGSGSAVVPPGTVPLPTGTTVLKGQ